MDVSLQRVSLLVIFTSVTWCPAASCPEVNIVNPTSPIHPGANYTFDCPYCNISTFLGDFFGFYFEVNGTQQIDVENVTVTAEEDRPIEIRCAFRYNVIVFSELSAPYVLIGTRVIEVINEVSNEYPLLGETVTFSCNVTYHNVSNAVPVIRWKNANSSIVTYGETLEISANSTLNYTCEAATGILWISAENPAIAWPRDLPVPTLVAPFDLYLYGNTYVFECQSTLHNASSVSYVWILDSHTFFTQNSRLPVSIDSPNQREELSCAISINDITSGFSVNRTVVAAVLTKPRLDPLSDGQYYLAGSSRTFTCHSDHANLSTITYRFEYANASIRAVVQTSPHLTVVVPGHHILNFTCSVYVINSTSLPSDHFVVRPSGILAITGISSDPTPLPGSNVTLTCSATLLPGFEESDVTYTWKEGNFVIANSKVMSIYVTTGMELLVRCFGSTGFVDVTSSVLNVTAEDLPVPIIAVANKRPEESYQPGYFYAFTCNSELDNQVTSYRWYKDGEVLPDVHTKYYLAQAMSTTHLYACSTLLTLEESDVSPILTVSTKSIESVDVQYNGQTYSALYPVFDSTLLMICIPNTKPRITHNPTYQWFQDGILVGVNRDLTFQAYPGFNHSVACKVNVGDDTMESPVVLITSQVFPRKPQLTMTNDDESNEQALVDLYPMGSYTLKCDSSSASLNTSISWYKDETPLPCAVEPTLRITRFNPIVHDGVYKCHTEVFGKSATSDPLNLAGSESGKLCQKSEDCLDQGEGYTGVCQEQRCVCSTGFKARLNLCTLI